MTEEQIRNMPAGPEMDGLVDELIFGIDRRATEHQIREAISGLVPLGTNWPGEDYDYVIEVDGIRWKLRLDRTQLTPEGGWPATWMWGQREGKPWQDALEKGVAAWRAHPRYPYSTDIAAAWQVVDACQYIRMSKYNVDGSDETVCWAVSAQLQYVYKEAKGEAAPLAICRAALLTKMGKQNGRIG